MGNTPNPMGNRQRAMGETMTCQDDLMCQNIDAKRSTVDNLVLVCPNATCGGGKCSCGAGCELDPYTGICCSKVEKDANGNTYCVEDPYVSNTGMNSRQTCKVPDQTINGTLVSGQKICDIYFKYS